MAVYSQESEGSKRGQDWQEYKQFGIANMNYIKEIF